MAALKLSTHLAALCASIFSLVQLAVGQQSLFPAAYPLAVRSPYFSAWEIAENETPIPNEWVHNWLLDLNNNYGWQGYVKVDGLNYMWRGPDTNGNPAVPPITPPSAVTVTPTRTIYTIPVGPMVLNITYLSPIEPGDMVRQSMPFSYVYIDAKSLDNKPHTLIVYADVSAEWTTSDRHAVVAWNTTSTPNSLFHAINLQQQSPFTESAEQAGWGTLIHATRSPFPGVKVADMINPDNACRSWFQMNGSLPGTLDGVFRDMSESWPVFAFSWDFGSIISTLEPAVFAVGFTREPAIQYIDLSGNAQNRSLYYMSQHPTMASARAETLDDRVLHDAAVVSSDYQNLVSLSARQVYGATELTIGKGSDGAWNASDVMMFTKTFGGQEPRRVNAVETLYKGWPLFMYLDPALGPSLLEPLLRFQNSSAWSNGYAARDIGTKYPVAQASSTGHSQRIEQSANMLIMAYAHVATTGNSSLVDRYYPLFKTWADFLVKNSVDVADDSGNETSADQEAGIQPNLALKGIIAVKAMSAISSKLQKNDDSGQYASNASSMTATWSTISLNDNGQILGSFGDNNSWTLGYNAFADAWLKTGIVSTDVVNAQTTLYKSLLKPGYGYYFGLPIDSQKPLNGSASAAWDIFSASIATDKSTSDAMISLMRTHASFNKSADIFSDLYDGSSGAVVAEQASVALGAMFAPLILDQLQTGFATPGLSGNSGSHRSTAGAIAGGVVGGVVLLGGIGFFIFRHHRRKQVRAQPEHYALDLGEAPPQASEITPFAQYAQYHEPTTASGSTFTPTEGQHERAPSHSDGTSSSAGASSAPTAPTAMSAATRKRMEVLGLAHAASQSPIGEEPDSPHNGSDNSNSAAAGDIQREVELLRQEMDVLRAGQERDMLPPSYDETLH